ncbi:hypothetical protein BD310DRAFT_345100 [Dichomitus squalens]|uniref:Uncharacterized protein n=1 Tax=Dichomitus squalens TaxID=114155 RepID=A0A4Q9PER6_9APHY|nr:hypothetical protein BD310DRAFT_345100 [Dichomitus squalens]
MQRLQHPFQSWATYTEETSVPFSPHGPAFWKSGTRSGAGPVPRGRDACTRRITRPTALQQVADRCMVRGVLECQQTFVQRRVCVVRGRFVADMYQTNLTKNAIHLHHLFPIDGQMAVKLPMHRSATASARFGRIRSRLKFGRFARFHGPRTRTSSPASCAHATAARLCET